MPGSVPNTDKLGKPSSFGSNLNQIHLDAPLNQIPSDVLSASGIGIDTNTYVGHALVVRIGRHFQPVRQTKTLSYWHSISNETKCQRTIDHDLWPSKDACACYPWVHLCANKPGRFSSSDDRKRITHQDSNKYLWYSVVKLCLYSLS